MEILVAASSLAKFPIGPQTSSRSQKYPRRQLLNCTSISKNTGENAGPSKDPAPVELHSLKGNKVHQQDDLDLIKNEKEEKHRNIWKLFKEAQQNISILNKQRVLAMEELDRVKNERDVLLDTLKQVEMKTLAHPGRGLCP